MKKFLIFILFSFLILLLVALDSGLLPGMGLLWNRLNVTLILSFFLIIILRTELAFIVYGVTIMLLFLLSSQLFLIPFFAGFLTLFFLSFLLERFFTNRSYYVLITLGSIGWMIYHLLFATFILITNFVNPGAFIEKITLSWFGHISFHLISVIVLLSIGYIATSFLSKRFRSYFIISSQ